MLDKTPQELCLDCETRGEFAVKCELGDGSWVCETCFGVRRDRKHGRQAFWERMAEAYTMRHTNVGCSTESATYYADHMLAAWEQRFR